MKRILNAAAVSILTMAVAPLTRAGVEWTSGAPSNSKTASATTPGTKPSAKATHSTSDSPAPRLHHQAAPAPSFFLDLDSPLFKALAAFSGTNVHFAKHVLTTTPGGSTITLADSNQSSGALFDNNITNTAGSIVTIASNTNSLLTNGSVSSSTGLATINPGVGSGTLTVAANTTNTAITGGTLNTALSDGTINLSTAGATFTGGIGTGLSTNVGLINSNVTTTAGTLVTGGVIYQTHTNTLTINPLGGGGTQTATLITGGTLINPAPNTSTSTLILAQPNTNSGSLAVLGGNTLSVSANNSADVLGGVATVGNLNSSNLTVLNGSGAIRTNNGSFASGSTLTVGGAVTLTRSAITGSDTFSGFLGVGTNGFRTFANTGPASVTFGPILNGGSLPIISPGSLFLGTNSTTINFADAAQLQQFITNGSLANFLATPGGQASHYSVQGGSSGIMSDLATPASLPEPTSVTTLGLMTIALFSRRKRSAK